MPSRRFQFSLSTILWAMFLLYPAYMLIWRHPITLLVVVALSFALKRMLDRAGRRPAAAPSSHPLDD